MSQDAHRPVTVVVGGASGIGAATAELLSERGHHVIVADRAIQGARAMVEAWRSRGLSGAAVELDVASPSTAPSLFERLEREGTQATGLVNCAGTNVRAAALDVRPEDWHRVLDVNLLGTFLTARAFAASLIRTGSSGAVVNVASMLAHYGSGNLISYASSKGGVAMLTRCLATEWAPSGIRVNAVSPGYIETALTTRIFSVPRYRRAILDRTPMRRFGRPIDLARAIAFLLADESAFVTGHVMPVDGGITGGDPTLTPPTDSEIDAELRVADR